MSAKTILTDEQTKEIRHLYANTKTTKSDLMSKYKIGPERFREICAGISRGNIRKKHNNIASGNDHSWAKIIERNTIIKNGLEELKGLIKVGSIIKTETIEGENKGRKAIISTLKVNQITDSNVFGVNENGRTESVQWSQVFCKQYKILEVMNNAQ